MEQVLTRPANPIPGFGPRRHPQDIRHLRRAGRCLFHGLSRRGPCASRRERRRQVIADECRLRPLPAEAGRLAIDGTEVTLSGPRDASARGIGMVHQHFKLVRPFTVAENMLLANPRSPFQAGIREIAAKSGHIRTGSISRSTRAVGSTNLSVAEQQRVEILKILIGGARILDSRRTDSGSDRSGGRTDAHDRAKPRAQRRDHRPRHINFSTSRIHDQVT